MTECNDLRLGGTLTPTGITGTAVTINDTALSVSDWSNLLGSWGISGQVQQVIGRPGGVLTGDLLGRERYPTLNMVINDLDHSGGLSEPTFAEQKQKNTDEFLGLITDPGGQWLELDMADGSSRILKVFNLDPAPIRQPRRQRTISVPLFSPMPYWKEGGVEDSDTVSGADTLVVGGDREVYDAVLTFSGDGTFTHSGLGWDIEIVGSTSPVTVDLGARTVTQAGQPADNLLRRSSRFWGWLVPGSNSVTADVSVGITWRASWA